MEVRGQGIFPVGDLFGQHRFGQTCRDQRAVYDLPQGETGFQTRHYLVGHQVLHFEGDARQRNHDLAVLFEPHAGGRAVGVEKHGAVIPAKIAGVEQIVMTTPAGKDGKIAPAILAAAHVAGVTTIVKAGGAQAVAALAYGTETVPRVDKIVGPGNIFVATAKRKVYGQVDIDMIAGPSEILVLADGTCNPAWVAADLLSQAEHDKLASAVLVTDSRELALAVQAELEVQIPQLPRAEIARTSIDTNGKIIVTDDMHKAVAAANLIAPEHLEVCVDDPFSLLNEIRNAGSIFLGKNVPEALGDYFAGPNHTLPTSGTARFSSPLSVDDFVKKSSFLYYTREALGKVQARIADFAEREGLHGHARSVTIRYEDEQKGE